MRTLPKGEIIFRLDMMLAREKMTVQELSELIGVHVTNLSFLKNGHSKAIKYKTMVNLCMALRCTPNDLFDIREKPPGSTDEEDIENAGAEAEETEDR